MPLEPLRKEFSVLWRTGLCQDSEEILETAAVCRIGLDSGDATLLHTFYKGPDEDVRAEDQLLEWLQDLPRLQEADDIHIKIFLNYSPQAATAIGLLTFIQEMAAQEKTVEMTIRFVRLYKVVDEDEASENKDGLRLLNRSKVTVGVVRECDWLFLMNVLMNREGKRKQGRGTDIVKQQLENIFKYPVDANTNTETVEGVDAGTMTDVEEVVEDVVEEKGSSSSDDDDD